ncbi:MAG TPA: alpha/beta hydrolase [Candidatus Limnocylindria bacterium]|nr:alpha/beta hydrolase [Candidatus Limnocylindria bacterium]
MGASAIAVGKAARVEEMHVHESGTPDSPAVVFVHGGGPSGRMWGAHLDRLAGRFYCLAPDLPGFGMSNHLAPLSLDETTDALAALIEARVPARRAHIVGLSYGGAVVIALLGRHPELVDRAVIDGAAVLPLWGGWGDRLVQLGVIAVSPIINTRLVPAALGRVGLRELGNELRSASPRAFRRAWFEGFTAPLTRAELAASCPTLFVAGEKEATVRASNAALAALMPHATAAFVPGLGHAWFGWRRELHVQMVQAWLSTEPLPAELIPEPPSLSAVDRVLHLLKSGEYEDGP